MNKILQESADLKLYESSFCFKTPECTGGDAVDAGAVVAVAVDLAEHQAQRCDLGSRVILNIILCRQTFKESIRR
jgi:hypothetical protein